MNERRYRQCPPDKRLSALIYGYWSLECSSEQEWVYEKIFPLQYPEFIVAYKGQYFEVGHDKLNVMPKSTLIPLQDQPRYFYHTGDLGLFSIVFKPSALSFILETNSDDFINKIIPSRDCGEKIHRLSNQLLQARCNNERVQLADRFFMHEKMSNEQRHIVIERIIQHLISRNGNIPISQIASKYNLSLSQLERQFKTTIGFTPKQYSRLIRFTQILNHYQSIPEWGQLITDIGFYDQSHLIREFKRFSGVSPRAYYDSSKGIVEQSILNDADFIQYNHHR
ncbi:helix-turn-helix domain-containing protein [Gracilibacillus suaedae]|uniref:helix-turn-helix domain-containing protein n=1 Tax=Gracilibacillus suaedae TaxID=2820273 RepID=UPI001ABE389A|nr:helix-turn-helix domain-containing protein [Gracilibacillus suaedae]